MKNFQHIAVAFFLLMIVAGGNTLCAQQRDSINVFKTIPRDSIAKKLPVDTLGNPPSASDSLDIVSAIPEGETKDTVFARAKKKKQLSRPKKAMLWAMAIPGGGQIYNRKYWKLPILYAGAGTLAYFWITNQLGYAEFRDAYERNYDLIQADATYQVYETNLTYGSSFVYTSINQLATERDTYRRYRDLSIAGSIVLYAISILDAYVDAHLSTFDIKDDLALTVNPLFYNYNNATFAPGLSLSLSFRNNRNTKKQLVHRYF